jgi:hypothetical protein
MADVGQTGVSNVEPYWKKLVRTHLISQWQNLAWWWLTTTFKIIGKHHFYFKVSGGALECYIHLLWLFDTFKIMFDTSVIQ